MSTISSINPRVFISIPSDKLSLHDSPINLAVNAPPTNFPIIAIKIKTKQTVHKYGVFNNPISVLSPVNTKNNGKNRETETSSIFSIINFLKLILVGIITPARKAPNNACIPIVCVINAELINIKNIKPTILLFSVSIFW
ncbi:MAG: hypothetical protein BWX61_01144 [Bacteroidetes bacterium ADurb.Bin035]|nr:MAG: hypothetical protein BWX61_01144 [Bacteroidetes bacterium ADurb.Bin035]